MTEEHEMSDPSTEDLRSVFDDLVGAPRPSGDLAERARRRGTALRRQRLSIVTAGVATVTVLVVPSVIAVRHDMSSGFGAGSTPTVKPTASAKAALPKAGAQEQSGTRQQKQRGLLGTTLGTPPGDPRVESYTVVEKAPTAQDTRRIDAAKHLLGSAFTMTGSGVTLNATTGKEVGTSATFKSASGESVGVIWVTVDATEKGNASWTEGTAGVSTGGGFGVGTGANASGNAAKDTVVTLGGAGSKGDVQISVKVSQPTPAADLLTTAKVDDLVNGLLAAES
jgi:hypothetical protein